MGSSRQTIWSHLRINAALILIEHFVFCSFSGFRATLFLVFVIIISFSFLPTITYLIGKNNIKLKIKGKYFVYFVKIERLRKFKIESE